MLSLKSEHHSGVMHEYEFLLVQLIPEQPDVLLGTLIFDIPESDCVYFLLITGLPNATWPATHK